jgi:hypothetical protein
MDPTNAEALWKKSEELAGESFLTSDFRPGNKKLLQMISLNVQVEGGALQKLNSADADSETPRRLRVEIRVVPRALTI